MRDSKSDVPTGAGISKWNKHLSETVDDYGEADDAEEARRLQTSVDDVPPLYRFQGGKLKGALKTLDGVCSRLERPI